MNLRVTVTIVASDSTEISVVCLPERRESVDPILIVRSDVVLMLLSFLG